MVLSFRLPPTVWCRQVMRSWPVSEEGLAMIHERDPQFQSFRSMIRDPLVGSF